jgi:hypothetical protein
MSNLTAGIQINLRHLNTMEISPEGTSVTVGGGVKGKALISHLWAAGKHAVTGGCECVGLTGAALGGGHGFLQGYYGLLSDQILSLDVVLADGARITVSPTQHPDLYWGMRGAGHNFGVVTSMQYRVYDVPEGKQTWSWEAFTLPVTPENIRRVYDIAADTLDTQPPGMMQYGAVLVNPAVSKAPVLIHNVVFNGPLSGIKEWSRRYHELDGVDVVREEGTYLDISRWIQIDAESLVCNLQDYMPGAGVMRFPVDVPAYNITALQLTVKRFVEMLAAGPEWTGSFFMIEQFSSHAVREKNNGESAYAGREDKLLIAPAFFFPSVDVETGVKNKELEEKATAYGEELRGYLVDGTRSTGGGHAYVNYAYGGESLEEIYGKDGLERLLGLKRKYDPHNRFRYYAPLAPANQDSDQGHSEL